MNNYVDLVPLGTETGQRQISVSTPRDAEVCMGRGPFSIPARRRARPGNLRLAFTVNNGHNSLMLRRWVIRLLCLFMCVVSVGAWVGSYFKQADVTHYGWWSQAHLVAINCGSIHLFVRNVLIYETPWRWRAEPARYGPADRACEYHFVGFGYNHDFVIGENWDVFVPLYFPTSLSALLLLFAWRRTRLKPVGTAFPVETREVKGTGTDKRLCLFKGPCCL